MNARRIRLLRDWLVHEIAAIDGYGIITECGRASVSPRDVDTDEIATCIACLGSRSDEAGKEER